MMSTCASIAYLLDPGALNFGIKLYLELLHPHFSAKGHHFDPRPSFKGKVTFTDKMRILTVANPVANPVANSTFA